MSYSNKTKEQLIKDIEQLKSELLNLKISKDKAATSLNDNDEIIRKLQKSENQFSLLIQQSPSVIEIYDLDGMQIFVNKAYEEMWKFPASTTVNNFNLLKSEEVKSTGLYQYINRAYQGESVIVPEYQFDPTGTTESDGHGRLRWLSTKIFPLKDNSGVVTNIVITHEDITDRKEIEKQMVEVLEREKEQADIIREAPMPFAFGYPDGRLENCNLAFSKLTGYSLAELKKINWNKVLTPSKWNDHETTILKQLTSENKVVTYEKEYIHKKGSIIPVELTVTGKFLNNELIHFLGFIKDISERKQAEEELKKHQEQLEELVSERTKKLEAKNLELDNAVKVFVGRELTIRNLQEKIRKLEGR